MSMDPKLTMAVYILAPVVFAAVVLYMILYTRGLKAKQAAMRAKGRPEVDVEEGIAIATSEKERAGRTGTIS